MVAVKMMTSVYDVIGMTPLHRLAELVDVTAHFFHGHPIGLLLQKLQHILQHTIIQGYKRGHSLFNTRSVFMSLFTIIITIGTHKIEITDKFRVILDSILTIIIMKICNVPTWHLKVLNITHNVH